MELDFKSFLQSQTVNSSVGLPANTANLVSCAAAGTPTNCVGNFSTSVKADWLFTLRPRVGYTWGQTLVYVTGGLALSKISLAQSYSDNINFGNLTGGSVSTSGSQTKAGWVVGAGIEQALANNWSLKAEYLYVKFDSISVPTGILGDSIPNDIAKFTNSVDLSSNIVRVEFNYKFGAFGARNTRDRLADVGVVKKPVTSSKPSRTATIRSALLPRPQRHRARAGINRRVIRAQECECGVVVLYDVNIIAGELRESRVV